MHIKENDYKYLKNKKLRQCFHAGNIKKKKRGIAIYIREVWKPQLMEKSMDGRILAIELNKEDQKIFLINIYVPNSSQTRFYKQLHEILRKYEPKIFVL